MGIIEGLSDEQIIATAARILLDDGNLEAVNILLDCDVEITWGYDENDVIINMVGPYLSVKDLRKGILKGRGLEGDLYNAITDAFSAVMPQECYVAHIIVRVKPVVVLEDWRSELLSAIQGGDIHNQAIDNKIDHIHVWEGLRFRSKSERKIAQALDRAGALFLPNCKARLGAFGKRMGREPDFLVCHNGKWGILEVDGEPFHPASRAVHDHARDRLFKAHGIIFIEHYDAEECYKNPDGVVKEFLTNLANA